MGEIRDGETAVGLVKKYNPDVVIMDIMLEGPMDGVETSEKIREFSDVPIIFITGNSDKKYITRAKQISNSKFMVKPISEEKLSRAVDIMLGE